MENIPYIEVNATWKKACQHFQDSFRDVEACHATRPTSEVQPHAKPFLVSLSSSGTPEYSNTYIFLAIFNS